MSKQKLIFGILLPLVLVVAGVGLFIGLRAPEPPRASLPDPDDATALLGFLPIADVAPVKLLSEPLNIDVSGTVVPYREVQLAAEVAGRVVEKDPLVRSGNYVEKGQVLYRIDPRDYELEIERLTRRREQELASIEELQQSIENVNALVEVAQEQLQLAEAEVRRFQNLGSRVSSATELDTARRSRLNSMNQLVTYQNQIRTFETQRSRLELAARLAETELDLAELNLERTVIRAPVDGRVVSEAVEVDSFVQRGTQLLVIEDTEKVEVACNIRMDQLSWILEQPNMSADKLLSANVDERYELPNAPVDVSFQITGRDQATYVWEGRLDRFDGAGLDPQSRTVPIRILVEEPHKFRTLHGSSVDSAGPPIMVRGMFVDVSIKASPTTRLLLVPKLAIKPSSRSSVIWRFQPDPDAVFLTPTAVAAKAAVEFRQENGIEPPPEPPEEPEGEKVDPAQWEPGRLEVIQDVRMVTGYWGDGEIDYWVCEVPTAGLAPGDRVIISPLPGVRADGNDAVRVKHLDAEPKAEVAGTQPSGVQL